MTDRPTPQIDRTNRAETRRQHLDSVRPRFESLSGVVGITLNGGLARGYADEHSEIDLTLFLEAEAYEEWSAGFAPITTGITIVDEQLYDISVAPLDSISEEWTETEKWDRSYAKILYDPTATLQTTFEKKLARSPDEDDIEGYLFECWWHFRLAGDCWHHREDPVQAHYILHEAVTALLKGVFVVNGEFVPHEKWLVHLSKSLGWTPDEWAEGLVEIVSADSSSVADFERRRERIEGFWTEVDRYARESFDPDLPVWFMQRTFYRAAQRLAKDETVPRSEWESIYGLEMLNQDPFSLLADVDEEVVRYDDAGPRSAVEEQMYDWHREILEAIQENGDGTSSEPPP